MARPPRLGRRLALRQSRARPRWQRRIVRQTIDDLAGSISRAQAEGVTEYSECLERKYERERRNQQAIYEGGKLIRHWWQHYGPPPPVRKVLFSGLPAEKTILGEVRTYITRRFSPVFKDKLWLDGPDAYLFRLHPLDEAEGNEDYKGYAIVPSEVLPAGSYQFRLHQQYAFFQVCGYYDELSRGGSRYPAEFGVLSPGRYTFEVSVELPEECSSGLTVSSYRERS